MKLNYWILFLMLGIPSIFKAHSGGTDRDGGHHDRYNGGYHFHHGHGPHQHPYGICELGKNHVKPYGRSFPEIQERPISIFQRLSWKEYLLMLLLGFGITRFYQIKYEGD